MNGRRRSIGWSREHAPGLPPPRLSIGGLFVVALVAVFWMKIPLARPFILCSLVLGGLIGLALWWKHP